MLLYCRVSPHINTQSIPGSGSMIILHQFKWSDYHPLRWKQRRKTLKIKTYHLLVGHHLYMSSCMHFGLFVPPTLTKPYTNKPNLTKLSYQTRSNQTQSKPKMPQENQTINQTELNKTKLNQYKRFSTQPNLKMIT